MSKKLKTEFSQLDNPYDSGEKCIASYCDGKIFTDKSLVRENSKGKLNIRWLCNKCSVKLEGFDYDKEVMPKIMAYREKISEIIENGLLF